MEGGKKRPDKDTSKGKKTQQDASGTAPTEGKAKSKGRNTYRLEPRTKVQDALVRDKAQAILTNKLQDATYDGASSAFLCASISEEILNAVKELDYDRYKYVVSVLIVEKANQAMIVFFHNQQLNLFEVDLKLLHSLWVVVSQVTIQGAAVILPNSLEVVAFMCSVASRCLWDVQRDTWVSAKCETDTFIALALVMACYYD